MTTDTELTHNVRQALPISFDGQPAKKCTKDGKLNPKGQYIIWETKVHATDNFSLTKIAKLFNPEDEIKPFDLIEAQKAVSSEARFDMRLSMSRNKARARLVNIFGKLGISYIDALNITNITPNVEVAAWASGSKENEEYILVNPYILFFKRSWASFVIQHEIMHRALYRGRQSLTDKILLNVALDICINRILAATHNGKASKAWNRFCRWIYPSESKTTVLALCNSALTEREVRVLRRINPLYAEIWESLYGHEQGHVIVGTTKKGLPKKKKIDGMLSFKIGDLSPDDLYFRLKSQLTDKDRKAMKALEQSEGLNPFGQLGSKVKLSNGREVILRAEGLDIAPAISKKIEEAIRKSLVPKKYRNINWRAFSDCRTKFWDKFVKGPEDLYDEDLEQYARRIHTQKIMNDISGKVTETFKTEVVHQTYPMILSEDGVLLALLGFTPPNFPFFQNINGPYGRRRVVVFFDLSPSTAPFWPYMSYMTKTFEDVMDMAFARNAEGDPGIMTFAGDVRSLSSQEIEEMRKGQIKVGNDTCFDSVIEYSVDKIHTEDVDAVIIFTDGDSSISEENIKKFNASQKNMYRIYFLEDRKENKGRIIESDLDRLNGTSFSLIVPKSDQVRI